MSHRRAPALTAALVLSLLLPTGAASAEVPLLVPLQGVLRDNAGAPVMDGAFAVTFRLYADADGAAEVWSETWAPTDGSDDCQASADGCVPVSAGVFRVQLGAVTPLTLDAFAQSGGALWLGMQVETDGELPLRPLGSTPFAIHAGSAADLACSGCLGPETLSPEAIGFLRDEALAAVAESGYATAAHELPYDDSDGELGADNVQDAVDALKAAIAAAGGDLGGGGPTQVNEGAGSVRNYTNQWELPPFGTATEYVHLLNPSPPKIVMYLYGNSTTGFSTGSNLVVAYDFKPNQVSSNVNGQAGETVIQVGNPSAFNPGTHILLYQTVGTGGAGEGAGNWELNAVKAIDGSTVQLVKPLEHTFTDNGPEDGQAQAVIAASYNNLEVVSGGTVRPPSVLDGNADSGGVVYIRAQSVKVGAGGIIHADGYGFQADGYYRQGDSECDADVPNASYNPAANCSGGGGTAGDSDCAAGGGGNKTAGQGGQGSYSCSAANMGKGGLARGDALGDILTFGGAGGSGNWSQGTGQGDGGGLVIIGASVITVEAGGRISANGTDGYTNNCGGGAGGTVALFYDNFLNEGTIEAVGGLGGKNNNNDGGDGGEGWVHELPTVPGIVNESFPKGVELWVDGVEVTDLVGDPNGKGHPAYHAGDGTWGATGLEAWSTGPLDLSGVANWTLGEHVVEIRETGGAGGQIKAYLYVVHTFTESQPPANDDCSAPEVIPVGTEPTVLSGTTEDTMGKTLATDVSSAESCGGAGGPDVVYQIDLPERSLLHAAVVAPFYAKLYIRAADCDAGELVYCAANELTTTPLDAGSYFLFVDSDSAAAKGDFTLALSRTPAPLPSNDVCDDALELIFSPSGVATHTWSTLYALDDYQSWCDTTGGGADVVYAFQAATGATIDINLDNATFDPILYLFKDACDAAPAQYCSATTELTIPSQQGGFYWLVVDGAAEKEWGSYDLTVTLTQ